MLYYLWVPTSVKPRILELRTYIIRMYDKYVGIHKHEFTPCNLTSLTRADARMRYLAEIATNLVLTIIMSNICV